MYELKRGDHRLYMENDNGELLAEITFPEENGICVIDHTWVSDELRGQGIAGKLVQEAVQVISEEGKEVQATCSYARKWLETHA